MNETERTIKRSISYLNFLKETNKTPSIDIKLTTAISALEKQLVPAQDNKFNYWRNICEIQAEQTAKGLLKYGYPLEQNTWLDINERLRYLQEELIDALMYIEHIKTLLNEGESK